MSMEPRIRHTAGEEAILQAFSARRKELAAYPRERAAALDLVVQDGLPTRRNEAWKFSDLRAALKSFPEPAGLPGAGDIASAKMNRPAIDISPLARLVFVNGRYVASLTEGQLPADIYFRDLTQAFERGDAYVEAHFGRLTAGNRDSALALNTAFTQGGAVLRIAPRAKIEAPIHLDFRFAGAPASVFPRLLILVGEGAQCTIIENHVGPDGRAYQSHAASEIIIAANARLTHVTVQKEGDAALALSHGFVELGQGSCYETFALDEGAAFQRRALSVRLTGEGANLALNGAVLARHRQHLDTTLQVDHAAAGCNSRETFKYVLGGHAHGVFQGKIIVRPDAQKTDGRMSARGLMLGDEAEFSAKPELEIFADDVQCAHGATAGQIDEDLAFYLRSRGLSEADAKALLVKAFVGEALEAVSDDALRGMLTERVGAWLDQTLADRNKS